MAFELIDLPYAQDALAPTISAETLSFHHGKHHKAYIDKTNAAVAGTALAEADLETVIKEARAKSDKGLFNNSAQSWNHGFYWNSLTPQGSAPAGDLAKLIDSSFGSLDQFKEKFAAAGAGHFASGWVWLAAHEGELFIKETHDADTLADSEMNPLLLLDVWEHAYYIDYRNDRPKHLAAAIELLNWDFAAENFARGSVWKYPAPAYA
jgi:Fe-Mn family superoxide dismutase